MIMRKGVANMATEDQRKSLRKFLDLADEFLAKWEIQDTVNFAKVFKGTEHEMAFAEFLIGYTNATALADNALKENECDTTSTQSF